MSFVNYSRSWRPADTVRVLGGAIASIRFSADSHVRPAAVGVNQGCCDILLCTVRPQVPPPARGKRRKSVARWLPHFTYSLAAAVCCTTLDALLYGTSYIYPITARLHSGVLYCTVFLCGFTAASAVLDYRVWHALASAYRYSHIDIGLCYSTASARYY